MPKEKMFKVRVRDKYGKKSEVIMGESSYKAMLRREFGMKRLRKETYNLIKKAFQPKEIKRRKKLRLMVNVSLSKSFAKKYSGINSPSIIKKIRKELPKKYVFKGINKQKTIRNKTIFNVFVSKRKLIRRKK